MIAQANDSARPFWQALVLQGFGPFVAAVVGSLGVGLALNIWSSRRAERIDSYNRRIEMIEEMARVFGKFRAAVHVFTRAQETKSFRVQWPRRGSHRARNRGESRPDDLARLRVEAISAYKKAIVGFRVVDWKLQSYFADEKVALAWHAANDCLLVWYYSALYAGHEETLKSVRAACARTETEEHSGLTLKQLEDSDRALKESYRRLQEAVRLARTAQLSVIEK
jgi:hypothetical protein